MEPTLSIRAPWAWLILYGGKNIENRMWNTGYRGRFLIHASGSAKEIEYSMAKRFVEARKLEIELPPVSQIPSGAIVGCVDLMGVSTPAEMPEWGNPDLQATFYPWGQKDSNFWWHLDRPTALPDPYPCRGQIGWFFPPL
jgi:hypothetical protein